MIWALGIVTALCVVITTFCVVLMRMMVVSHEEDIENAYRRGRLMGYKQGYEFGMDKRNRGPKI